MGDSGKALKEGPSSFKSTRNIDRGNLNVNCLLDFHVKHLYPSLWLQFDDARTLNNEPNNLTVICWEANFQILLKFLVHFRLYDIK